MKKLLLLALLSMTVSFAQAQAAADTDEETANEVVIGKPEYDNPLSTIVMTNKDNKLSFIGIADFSHLQAYIANVNGDMLIQKNINAKKNVVDISRLKSGTYFVTILNDATGKRKTFTLKK